MANKKLTTKKSVVTTNDGEDGDGKKYVIVDSARTACSKILTGKAAASREARRWLNDNYYGSSALFVAELVGRVQKRGEAANDLPTIEV